MKQFRKSFLKLFNILFKFYRFVGYFEYIIRFIFRVMSCIREVGIKNIKKIKILDMFYKKYIIFLLFV